MFLSLFLFVSPEGVFRIQVQKLRDCHKKSTWGGWCKHGERPEVFEGGCLSLQPLTLSGTHSLQVYNLGQS